jgi:hypothetical protein
MVSHESERKGAVKGNRNREEPCEEIDHGDGKEPENHRNDTKVPFRFCEWIELV